MNKEELEQQFRSIDNKIQEIETEKKQLAWQEGVPYIIAKMKEHGRDKLYLRKLERDGCFCTEALWFCNHEGKVAARILKLENDRLIVVYNLLTNHEETYEDWWDYGDQDHEEEIDEILAGRLISQLFPEIVMYEETVFTYEGEDD